MEIACSCDVRYAADCAVMLASLLAQHPDGSVCIHLLHDDQLPEVQVGLLQRLVEERGGQFRSHADLHRRLPKLAWNERFPLSAWYRVLLPELLPELSRVLYIDADALIVNCLDELWTMSLDDYLLGAVTSPLLSDMVPRIENGLGLDPRTYFNSGVLLIDLEAWRGESISAQLLDFARSHRGLSWPDQDTLNSVLHDRRLSLHPRWNAMLLWDLPERLLPYSTSAIAAARSAPAIIHFIGPHKPWHYRSRHPFRDEFLGYLKQTPWRERPIEGRSFAHVLLRPLPWLWSYRIEVAAQEWPNRARMSWWRMKGAAARRLRPRL